MYAVESSNKQGISDSGQISITLIVIIIKKEVSTLLSQRKLRSLFRTRASYYVVVTRISLPFYSTQAELCWIMIAPWKAYKKYFPNRKCPLHSNIIQVSSRQISHYPLINLALDTDIKITPSPFSHLVKLILLFYNKIIATKGSGSSVLIHI